MASWFRPLLVGSLSLALVFACSAESGADDDDDNGSSSSSGSTKRSDAGKDSGTQKPKDAGKDARPTEPEPDGGDEPDDAGPTEDGGPTLISPDPGTPCTRPAEIFSRTCGSCGSQIASCVNGAVTGYGTCRDSAEGACTPGERQPGAACGACGTGTRVCTDQCVWENEDVCAGEVPGGCIPGRTEQRPGACPTGQTLVYECTAACAWEVQAGASCTGSSTFPSITIATTAGGQVNRDVTAAEQTQGRRNTFYSCAEVSAQTVYGRTFELINPSAQAAVVHVWNTVAVQTWDFVMVAYDSAPLSVDDLIPACIAVNDECSFPAYAPEANVCFAGGTAITIPANSRRWVYIGNFGQADPARAYTLRVTTASLQP